MVKMDKQLDKKIDDTEKRFKLEMKSGVEHMKKFEGLVKDLVKGLEYAHAHIDTRAIQNKAAVKRIETLEERVDVLTGQVGYVPASVDS